MRWKFWVRYRIFLYFLLGLAAVDGVLYAVRKPLAAYDPDDYQERVENCRHRRPDLVLVGGSVVAEGLDPAALVNLPWKDGAIAHPFNLGLPGATVSEIWHAVEHGLKTPPKLLVYGITASDLNDGRQMPHGPWSLMDRGDVVEWLRCRPRSAEWVCRNYFGGKCARLWKLYQYRNALRLWAAECAERFWPGSFPEEAREARRLTNYTDAMRRPDGFAPQEAVRFIRLDQYRAAGRVQPSHWALKDYQIGGGHLRDLHRLLDWAETNGVSVVLLDMPVSPDLEEQMHPREFAAYRSTLAALARERRVKVLHASRKVVGLGDREFCDEIHLNRAGCNRLSAWLRSALASRGALP